ncbi:MAG: aldehyde dehydrogenase family protein [Actinobacteria bacterium]|nr:aldehyde dehydrogenase family protein [Actinomycetota bacterium]
MAVQQIISPVDGSVYAERTTATSDQIEALLAKAQAAQAGWRATPIAERAAIVERMVVAMQAEVESISTELAWQMGRPISHAPLEINRGFQERARHMASIAADSLADVAAPPKDGFTRFIRKEPVGTVLVVAPWNFPYLTSVNSIVPALMAGNTIVLKHATQTLLCAERYTQAMQAAGMPEGVFQHVHATHADVAKMIGDERIGFVVFTGSVEGGHSIQRNASDRFIGTGMELGGKDPAYVRTDCDLAYTIGETVDGVFFNSGQSCCSIERIYVEAGIYDEFVEGFVDLTRKYVLGNPLDTATNLGPMVSAKAADFVRGQVAEAIGQGARAIVSESEFAASQVGTPYLAPVVLTGVDHSMRVMTEESFGPVIGIMKVASDEEAIRLMNDSPYGLTASIWTNDIGAALSIGDQVETGTWYMNRCDYVDPALVWTGVKDTGRGVALSVLGFDSFTRPKSFHLKSV